MKHLNIFLTEKLTLNKTSQADATLLDLAKDKKFIDDLKAKNINILSIPYPTPSEGWRDETKMQEYFKKGSKPTVLVNSIKDNKKLLRRFAIAVKMKWDECIEVFGDTIIERKPFSLNRLNDTIKESVILYIAQNYK